MKTPRELLFERHRSAEARLDAVREQALKSLGQGRRVAGPDATLAGSTALPANRLTAALRQLFWPHPRAWAGLAAVWIVILAMHLSTRDESGVVAKTNPRPSPEVALALKQQRQLRAELIGQTAALEADRPRPLLLRPRSERRDERSFA